MAEQVPLSDADGERASALYPPASEAILVAGQALATWVDVFQLPVPDALSAGVTRDVDILGNRDAAEAHYRVLTDRGLRANLYVPSFGDITPNTAKLVVHPRDGSSVPDEIDYLGSLCGYLLEDEERLRARAIPIDFPDHPNAIRVMHPFDCLKSRVHNLAILTAKQNKKGQAQAKLAIQVLGAYFQQIPKDDAKQVRSLLLPMAEAVIDLAASNDGVRAFHEFGVNVLEAIDVSRFPAAFQTNRWPRAVQFIQRRRFGRNGGTRPQPTRDLT